MSITVMIPKEITDYEEKIIFGLSLRKLGCLTLAAAVGGGTYLLCVKALGLTMDATSYVIILETLPLMAIGFITINGMRLERYIALVLRHTFGVNRLAYKTELVIDALPAAPGDKERKSKYAWIFATEKEKGNNPGGRRGRRKSDNAREESSVFQVTRAGRKRRRAAARRSIKAARKEFREAKRGAKNEAPRGSDAEIHGAAS